MHTITLAVLVGICCLAIAGCWGLERYDDEAQGRQVREIKTSADVEREWRETHEEWVRKRQAQWIRDNERFQ